MKLCTSADECGYVQERLARAEQAEAKLSQVQALIAEWEKLAEAYRGSSSEHSGTLVPEHICDRLAERKLRDCADQLRRTLTDTLE